MGEIVTISKKEYKELAEKAKILEGIIDKEDLKYTELKKHRKFRKNNILTEKEAKKKDEEKAKLLKEGYIEMRKK